MNDPDSVLALHRRLLALRRAAPAIAVGSYIGLPSPGPVLGYTRRLAGQSTYLVALNLSDAPAEFSPDGRDAGTIAVGTNRARDGERALRPVHLAAHEGIVVRLDR
jgi:alpha-glucosidase